jgi:hypothetical protein
MDNNKLTEIRVLLDGMKGHNYGLPDCLKFILERIRLNEKPDFWDIAVITGDTVAQIYNHNLTTSCDYSVSGYLAGPEHIAYVFDVLGYKHEYAGAKQVNVDKVFYQRKIVEYIDKGVPVLVITNINDIPAWDSDVGTYCLIIGYENSGQKIKLLVGDTTIVDYDISDKNKLDLAFIGEKQCEVTLEKLYINAIRKMPYWLTHPEHDGMFFGASAYRKWADDIETGRFEDSNLALWENYGVYVCNLATSGGEPTFIFRKLAEMNSAYSELAVLGDKIQELLPAETPTGGRSLLWIKLEELKGGMNMDEVGITMRNKEKRITVASVLRDYADRLDKVVELLNTWLNKL